MPARRIRNDLLGIDNTLEDTQDTPRGPDRCRHCGATLGPVWERWAFNPEYGTAPHLERFTEYAHVPSERWPDLDGPYHGGCIVDAWHGRHPAPSRARRAPRGPRMTFTLTPGRQFRVHLCCDHPAPEQAEPRDHAFTIRCANCHTRWMEASW